MTRASRPASSSGTGELIARLDASPRLDPHRYSVEEEVGSGGMGSVLRIHDRHLNRRLAMKVMLEGRSVSEMASDRRALQVLSRFLEEAQVTSQLDHPGVVPVHELGLDASGKVYFTMRLVQGLTAAEVFDLAHAGGEDWTLPRALDVVLKVCDTVAYAHDKGVLHRDLKPTNVMVGRFGEVYVMDWGLAKVQGAPEPSGSVDDAVRTTRVEDAASGAGGTLASLGNHRVGTPCYMSPEQARGEPLDARTDVYALGAMLYQLLAGFPPYLVPGVVRTGAEVLEAVLSGPPARVEALRKDVPAELVAVVDKAMARDRGSRYGSVTELSKDLRAFLDQRAVGAYRTGALVELRLWVRRNRPLAVALASAVMILVLGVVVATGYARENAALAEEKGELAVAESRARTEAEQNAGRLEVKVREFDLLSGAVLLDRLEESEQELYPAWPGRVAAMESWLEGDAAKLLAMKPEIAAAVDNLRAQALPWTEEQQQRDRESHPRYREYAEVVRQLAAIRAGSVLQRLATTKERYHLEKKERELVAEVGTRRTYHLGNGPGKWVQQFLLDTLTELQTRLVVWEQDTVPRVRTRLAWARMLSEQKLSLAHPKARVGWPEARAAIRSSPRYQTVAGDLASGSSAPPVPVAQTRVAGTVVSRMPFAPTRGSVLDLRDEDVMDLVPIGANPVTGLWEFYHLPSAWDGKSDPREIEIPVHAADGSIPVGEQTGIVFVLLPGGISTMGSSPDPDSPWHDPAHRPDEALHMVELEPFLLARHEMSAAQWQRMWNWDESRRRPSQTEIGTTDGRGGTMGLAHPVESVSAEECGQLLGRHGLTLPTEAQWEYGCRAGTATPWGVPKESLRLHANLNDLKAGIVSKLGDVEPWNDGHVLMTVGGSLAANPFGLHDMIGNVSEWTLDWYSGYGTERAGDGLRSPVGATKERVIRGGNCVSRSRVARAAGPRITMLPTLSELTIGVRAARSLSAPNR